MNWKKKWCSIISILLLAVSITTSCNQSTSNIKSSRVSTLPYYQEPSFTPYWMDPQTDDVNGFHAIPKFKLINQLGDTVTEQTFDHKIYVTDFFFATCPGICPKMTDNMLLLQEAFINDPEVLLLSHSVTPKIDSVAVLQNYAQEKGILSSKWHLVTGDRKQIYDLGRNHYYVEEDLGLQRDEDDFLHTENFLLIDKNKHIRGIYNGLNKTAINQLVADIKTLKLEE